MQRKWTKVVWFQQAVVVVLGPMMLTSDVLSLSTIGRMEQDQICRGVAHLSPRTTMQKGSWHAVCFWSNSLCHCMQKIFSRTLQRSGEQCCLPKSLFNVFSWSPSNFQSLNSLTASVADSLRSFANVATSCSPKITSSALSLGQKVLIHWL